MKLLKFHTLFLFIIIANSLWAQQKEDKKSRDLGYTKHEIRLVFENFSIKKSDNYQINNINPLINDKLLYGLGYNLNFKFLSLRSKVFYYSSEQLPYLLSSNSNTYQLPSNEHFFRTTLGINYRKKSNNLALTTGVDFGYFVYSNGAYKSFSNAEGYSVEPLIGFKSFLFKWLSINAEMKIVLGKYSLHDIHNWLVIGGPPGSSSVWRDQSYNNIFYAQYLLTSVSLNFNF